MQAARPRADGVLARLVEDADEVDHRSGAARERRQRRRVADVGLDDLDRGQQEQVPGIVAATSGDDDPDAGTGQARNDVPADETAAADDHDLLHQDAAFQLDAAVAGDAVTATASLGITVPSRVVSAT